MNNCKLLILFILATSFFYSCSSKRVMTVWEEPRNSVIRIVNGSTGSILVEQRVPVNIEFGLTKTPHFVEIKTPNNQRIFGTVNVVAATSFTDYSTIKIEITPSMVNQIINNQVSQITINDPTTGRRGQVIMQLTFGNRMMPDMERLYQRRRLQLL